MENKEEYKEALVNFEQEDNSSDRRYLERRREPKEGFTYISTVGWICRREQSRRRDDSCDF